MSAATMIKNELSAFLSLFRKKSKNVPSSPVDEGFQSQTENEKKSESVDIPLSMLPIFNRVAEEFNALNLKVSTSYTPDSQPEGYPKMLQTGKLKIQTEESNFLEKYLAIAKKISDAHIKAEGDPSELPYRKKLYKFASKVVHEVALQLAEQKNQDIAQIYKDKINHPNYLPSIDDLRQAFKTKSEFDEWTNRNLLYEVFTHEYILDLSEYITRRYTELANRKDSIVVLEVGAGNGKLSHFLESVTQESSTTQDDILQKISFIATDDSSWTTTDDGTKVTIGNNVEQADYKTAIEQYHPDIVLTSWMPPNTDWSQFFREQDVPEYILIGRADDGVNGTLNETWSIPSETDYNYNPSQQYTRYDMAMHQISMHDTPPFDREHAYSSTVSFRKNN